MKLIKVPKKFYADHCDMDLPAPEVIKETQRHYHLSPDNAEALAELLNNAEHYSDCAGIGWDFDGQLGMQSSARATVQAIQRHHAATKVEPPKAMLISSRTTDMICVVCDAPFTGNDQQKHTCSVPCRVCLDKSSRDIETARKQYKKDNQKAAVFDQFLLAKR